MNELDRILAHYFLPQPEPVHRKAAEEIKALITSQRQEAVEETLKKVRLFIPRSIDGTNAEHPLQKSCNQAHEFIDAALQEKGQTDGR